MATNDNILFEDMFSIKDVDRDGKKFDRVSRIHARSENFEMELTVDINSDLYPLDPGDKFSLALASTLSKEGIVKDTSGERETWRENRSGERTLADDYEYVMYGKVYRLDDAESEQKCTVYMSFGGLLCGLEGDYRHVSQIVVGENVYLLMRK